MSELTEPKSPPRLRALAQIGLAILVSILALWWAFHDADLERMVEDLGRSSPAIVVTYVLGFLVLHALRVVRWGLHVRALEPGVSWRAVTAAANIGIAATFFIPLRLGEFVRPMLIHRSGVRFGGAVASIVVERIADGLCSVGMFFVFFNFVPASAQIPNELGRLSVMATFAFGGGLVFLIAAALAREPVLGLTRAILRRVSAGLADRVVGLVATFLDGLGALGSAWRAALYIALTLAFWLGNGLFTWVLASSYAESLPVAAGLFTISVLVFAIMIPAGPAFAGTFEAGFKLGFGAFGLDPSSTIVVAVIAHVVQLLMMASFVGIGLAVAEPGQRSQKRRPSVKSESSPHSQDPLR